MGYESKAHFFFLSLLRLSKFYDLFSWARNDAEKGPKGPGCSIPLRLDLGGKQLCVDVSGLFSDGSQSDLQLWVGDVEQRTNPKLVLKTTTTNIKVVARGHGYEIENRSSSQLQTRLRTTHPSTFNIRLCDNKTWRGLSMICVFPGGHSASFVHCHVCKKKWNPRHILRIEAILTNETSPQTSHRIYL